MLIKFEELIYKITLTNDLNSLTNASMYSVGHDGRLDDDSAHFDLTAEVDVIRPLDAQVYRLQHIIACVVVDNVKGKKWDRKEKWFIEKEED